LEHILAAVTFVATHGWALLPEYRFDPYNGLWRHRGGVVEPPLRLTDLKYTADGELHWPGRSAAHERAGEDALSGYLVEAAEVVAKLPPANPEAAGPPMSPGGLGRGAGTKVSPGFEELRWFDLPEACLR
jgi:hypothetical protein